MLTASKDWNIVLWDLMSETDPPRRKTTVRFDAPVASASFHPRNKINGAAALALAVPVPFVSPDGQAVVPFPAVFIPGAGKLLAL